MLSPDGVSRELLRSITDEPATLDDRLDTLRGAAQLELAGHLVVMDQDTQRAFRDRPGHDLPALLELAAQRLPDEAGSHGDELVGHITTL